MKAKKLNKHIINEIALPEKEGQTKPLLEKEKTWESHWWGMPEFTHKKASPQFQVLVNFMTKDDIAEFENKIGYKIGGQKSVWYPKREKLKPGKYFYSGPSKSTCRYPICIPSKGRATRQKTGLLLDRFGLPYKFFVEETEADAYIKALGKDKVVVMPFHDLGKGSIPARNFIWEWAKAGKHDRHWVMDDNILHFARLNFNRKLIVRRGNFFAAMEDFVDRYENIVMAGPDDRKFISAMDMSKPYRLNTRIYSCILLDTNQPHRWRGKYNEDTDLSIRFLKDGLCTILFHALLMAKDATHKGDGKSGGIGGNSEEIYEKGDYRIKFAKSLAKQHPDCAKVVWRYGRWHHEVNYDLFKRNKPILKSGVVPVAEENEYNMELRKRKED